MSMLAREKYECLKYAYNAQQGGKECNILVKVGLKTDDPDRNEHIWFELLGFEGDDFIGELTQDPFYVDYIKKGDKGKYSVNDITDWIIYTPEYNVRPETAYLMM